LKKSKELKQLKSQKVEAVKESKAERSISVTSRVKMLNESKAQDTIALAFRLFQLLKLFQLFRLLQLLKLARWFSVIPKLDLGVERNQGEIKLFQRFIFFRDDKKVLSNFSNEAGGGYLGTNKGVGIAHCLKVGQLSARGAVRIFPIDFSGPEPNPINYSTFWLSHDRSNPLNALLGRYDAEAHCYKATGHLGGLQGLSLLI
jgi:hypothetical protein